LTGCSINFGSFPVVSNIRAKRPGKAFAGQINLGYLSLFEIFPSYRDHIPGFPVAGVYRCHPWHGLPKRHEAGGQEKWHRKRQSHLKSPLLVFNVCPLHLKFKRARKPAESE